MAGEWRTTTVGAFTPFSYGKGLPEATRNPTGSVSVFGSNGVVGRHDRSLTEGPTIVIGRKGTVGAVHYCPDPCWPIDTTFFISGTDSALVRFRYYLLKGLALEDMNADSAVPGLNRDAAHARVITIPSAEAEQRAIAHILGTLDDKIELNRRMNETLEEIARAIFKSWFVDFDPVRAKIEGRWRRGESLPGLPAHLYDLFPDRFRDSELGEIPEGWEVRALAGIGRFLNGLALQKHPPQGDRSLPVIKIAQLRSGDTRGADRASPDLDPQYVVDDGDVLFSWSGSLDCVLWTGGKGALNQHLFKVTSTEFRTWFLYLWITQHLDDFRHIAAGKATTMGHIQRHHLSDAKVVVPARDTLKAADDALSPLVERIITTRTESRTLAALRDALLPKLISGELRLPAALRDTAAQAGVKDAGRFGERGDVGLTRTDTDGHRSARGDADGHGQTDRNKSAPSVSVGVGQCRTAPSSGELVANAALSLLNITCYFLDRQLGTQAAVFEKEGGFTERLYKQRQSRRRHG